MATKDFDVNLKLSTVSSKSQNGQYRNLNLNASHKCSTVAAAEIFTSKSNSFKNGRKDCECNLRATVTDFSNFSQTKHGTNFMKTNDKMNVKTSQFLKHRDCKNETQKRWQKQEKDNVGNSCAYSSTLSLHIAAYEDSVENGNQNKSIKTEPSDSWEFPRQQRDNKGGEPEIMQFKSPQKLYTPNQKSEHSRLSRKQGFPVHPSWQPSTTRASGQRAEMADTTGRSGRESDNNNDSSLSGEGLSLKSSKKINPAVAKALEEIKGWFHGKMDRFKASKLLKNDGDFLIRLGKSMDDLLYKPVLTVKRGDRFFHFLIKEKNSLFWIEKKQFASIASLLRYFMQTQDPITCYSRATIKTPISSNKFNARIARSERDKRKSELDLRLSDSRVGVVQAAQSLSYALLGENAPFILATLGKIAILCVVVIFLYICTVF